LRGMTTVKLTSRPMRVISLLVPLAAAALLGASCADSPAVAKQKKLAAGERYLKDGKPNEAIIELRNAIQIDKDYVPAIHALGRAYLAKSWVPDAARELTRAQTLSPGSIPITLDLGRAYAELGLWPEAQEQATKVLDLEPQNPQALGLRAVTLFGQGRYDQSLALIASLPKDAQGEVAWVRGQVFLAQNNLDAAQQAFNESLNANPRD